MALNYNGTEITDVNFNGIELDVVNIDGVKVFEKIRDVEITETLTANELVCIETTSSMTGSVDGYSVFNLSHTPIGDVKIVSGTYYLVGKYTGSSFLKGTYYLNTNTYKNHSVNGNVLTINTKHSGAKSNSKTQYTTPKSTVTVTYKYKP